MTLRVSGLTPSAWLNRCALAFPEDAAQALDGLTSEDGPALLKALGERFEAFDEYIGRCPVRLEPSFVANTRLLLGSLKKFRDNVGEESELAAAAEARYVSNNSAAKAGQIPRRFVEGMRDFLKTVLARYRDVWHSPHFGPGAVAERMSQVKRWNAVAETPQYDFRDPDDISCWGVGLSVPCARLQAVPKDWNKMRLITVEPYEQSYLQHYTRECLLKALRGCRVAGLRALADPKRVDPQRRHRVLACRGSMDGSLATLDMSDASDLVSFDQVAEVFPSGVMADLERSRSTEFTTAGGSAPARIYMYAGMGNATTFTVETLMFHAACHAVARYHRLPYRDSFVSVYGDDMIVSTRLAELLVELHIFEEFGWRLNQNKSYWRSGSLFRESCGGQYYAGHDVTLLRYQGGYHGTMGLVAYRDLIMRAARNPRWRPVTWTEWTEQNMPNSTEWITEGALLTSVPWWPNTINRPARYHTGLWEWQLSCPTVTIPRRVITDTRLGCVYGSIAGQLAGQTGDRKSVV